MKKKQKLLKRIGWVGLVNNKPYYEPTTDNYCSWGEEIQAVNIYKSKRDAKRRYQTIYEVFILC